MALRFLLRGRQIDIVPCPRKRLFQQLRNERLVFKQEDPRCLRGFCLPSYWPTRLGEIGLTGLQRKEQNRLRPLENSGSKSQGRYSRGMPSP